MKKSVNPIRVVAFYALVTLLVIAMMFTAKGCVIPFLQEEGLISLMQLFGGFTGVYGIICRDNGENKKGAWYVISGMIIAAFGSVATAVLYFLLILVTMLIGDDALWKKFDSLAKE